MHSVTAAQMDSAEWPPEAPWDLALVCLTKFTHLLPLPPFSLLSNHTNPLSTLHRPHAFSSLRGFIRAVPLWGTPFSILFM